MGQDAIVESVKRRKTNLLDEFHSSSSGVDEKNQAHSSTALAIDSIENKRQKQTSLALRVDMNSPAIPNIVTPPAVSSFKPDPLAAGDAKESSASPPLPPPPPSSSPAIEIDAELHATTEDPLLLATGTALAVKHDVPATALSPLRLSSPEDEDENEQARERKEQNIETKQEVSPAIFNTNECAGKKRPRDKTNVNISSCVDDMIKNKDHDEYQYCKLESPISPSVSGSSKNCKMAKLLDINRWWEAKSPQERASLEEKQGHLNGIATGDQHSADQALQMLLWDIGFEYSVYAHQFEAIRFVAGLVPTFPFPELTHQSETKKPSRFCALERNETGAVARSKAVLSASKESFRWHKEEANKSKTTDNNDNNDFDNTKYAKPYNYILPTRGMLLADEMGLGKTIEALAGAALRNATLRYSNLLGLPSSSSKTLPTLIVSPQDGIQEQWYDTLVKSGVKPSNITVLGDTQTQTLERHNRYNTSSSPGKKFGGLRRQGGSFILCTRYKIQSELRLLFAHPDCQINNKNKNKKARLSNSSNQWHTTAKQRGKGNYLFPHISQALIVKVRNQYRADKGKERNKFIQKKEKRPDCVARLIREERTKSWNKSNRMYRAAFQTMIVDEAHFCKNVLAFWGLGLALLGFQSKRTVLLSGTPYNNGPADMSALMTYIDPSHEAAGIDWWNEAVTKTSSSVGSVRNKGKNTVSAVSHWRKDFMLRRSKDVLLQKLPPRIRIETDVGAHPSELWIYAAYEQKFLEALRRLKMNMEEGSPEAQHRMKKAFELMMAYMACMRMSLIHPVMPGGREVTIHFSPSRRHLLKRQECPNRCVLCSSDPTHMAEKVAAKRNEGEKREHGSKGVDHKCKDENGDDDDDDGILALVGAMRTEMDLYDDDLDDEDFDFEAKSKRERELEEKRLGPIIPLDPDFCDASGSECRHFAHEKCIEKYHADFGDDARCPRCYCLQRRVRQNLRHSVYCEEIKTHIHDMPGGFIASSKIEEAIKWFRTTVSGNEKAIILSFFKGSLDLIEGILTTKFGIECVRYDGDVSKETRTSDLERFKTKATCRVLLATVQSGGTGLNITEANHVCFLDRWFNPCVHDQAESRCHRIGQKKDVHISYLDINLTIDIVMKRINVLKEGNANVILADGTSLGDRWSLGYKNVSGVIGNTLTALLAMREETINKNGDAPLPPYDESLLVKKMEEIQARIGNLESNETKQEETRVESKQTAILLDSDDDDEIFNRCPAFAQVNPEKKEIPTRRLTSLNQLGQKRSPILDKVTTEMRGTRTKHSTSFSRVPSQPMSDDDDDCSFLHKGPIFKHM